ncbi:LamG domain-containing protein [Bdellovibrio bacteriovorus]|uniref:LamG domain-containing protein n=1 Tax=Bdellovibrio bacteriovorus TaxID=959 RepID=UPI0035A6CD44
MRIWLVLLFSLSLAGCGVLSSTIELPSKEAPPVAIPIVSDNFVVAYDGEGQVTFDNSKMTLTPKASTSADETHAALVFLKQTLDTPVMDFELSVDLTVTQQLRQNSAANDWEVFWLFFNHQGSITEKTTNYFISKPSSGSELGLAHGELGQKFLNTDPTGKTPIGSKHSFKFRRQNGKFTVHRDGTLFYSFTETDAFPQKLYAQKGSIGFYSEDASVDIHAVSLLRLDKVTPPSFVLPLLSVIPATIKPPGADSALKVTATNSAQLGPLFWSCNFQRIATPSPLPAVQDCHSLGAVGSDGTLSWTPAMSDIVSWFLHFEASELHAGFAKKTAYVQIRPSWTESHGLFLYDPQFSVRKNIDTHEVLQARAPASIDDNKTSPWPNLLNSDEVDLVGLNEVAPWGTDTDSQMSALHFNALHDDLGLPLPISNLGSTKDIRLSYWFKRDNADSKAAMQINHGNGYLQSRHWFNVIASTYKDGGSEVSCYDLTPATDAWTFVTSQVIDNLDGTGTLKTFVNGRQVCAENLPSTNSFLSPLRLAPRAEVFYPFAGKLSEIAGFTKSTPEEIFNDFANTADRYRSYKVGQIKKSDLLLHWDIANTHQGMMPPTSASVVTLADLGPTSFSKTFGGFDGTPSSGYNTATPSRSHIAFDGSDDYIQISSNPNLSAGANWTIEAWLQPGNAKGVDNAYSADDVRHPLFKTVYEKAFYDVPNKASHGMGLRLGPNNTVDAFMVNSYGYTDTISGGLSLNANTWYHIAVSFDKTTSTLKAYVNGAMTSSKVVNYMRDIAGMPQSDADVLSEASDAYIGIPADVDMRRRFNGKFAILRVYNKALSDAQIKTHCQTQKNRFDVTCN